MTVEMGYVSEDGSVVAALRRETRAQHERLEEELDLLSPLLDRGRYTRVLLAFAHVYGPVEAQMAGGLGTELVRQLDWVNRAKTAWLESDLEALGINPPLRSHTQAAVDVSTPERALGVLYVMEGATLGAQVIKPHLLTTIHLEEDVTRFFDSYGEHVGRMWGTMRTVLRERIVTETQRGIALDGAKSMFLALSAGFRRGHAVSAKEVGV